MSYSTDYTNPPDDPQVARLRAEVAQLKKHQNEVLIARMHDAKRSQDIMSSASAYLHAALDKLAEVGWVPFGTHDVGPTLPQLEFSTQVDEAGRPYFERPAV